MIDPGWVSAGLLAAGMITSAGIQIGIVKGIEKRQNEETEKSDEFRTNVELKLDRMRESVATGFVQGAVFGERLTRLEQELERKRLQHHELANRVSSIEARIDARIETIERRMVRKEGS